MTRRTFSALLASAAAARPNDKLNIAAVGIGGMGQNYIAGCETENIVALCDVDTDYAAKVFEKYPKAARYKDYRVMLEKEKSIDAVIVGTPDHTHAVISMAAMELGKHVYCAKPLTRTITEARLLAKTAREKKLATQMSVQSCASDDSLTVAEWVQSGAIGPVREVHIWSDRPVWPQGIERPAETPPVPAHLDWKLWLGPAPDRPYHPIYHPFNFRGWFDFGTGALGDMACHALHVVFTALKLEQPTSVHASTSFQMVPAPKEKADESWMRARTLKLTETFPSASHVTWDFPARAGLPPVRLHWYDGGIRPSPPTALRNGKRFGADGLMFVGDNGVLLSEFTGGKPHIAGNEGARPPEKTLERTIGHYAEWIAACKGGKPARCEFGFGSLLTEVALLGVIAQRTKRYLEWDAAAGRFTNDTEANGMI
jgi:predicted dehydrogenase